MTCQVSSTTMTMRTIGLTTTTLTTPTQVTATQPTTTIITAIPLPVMPVTTTVTPTVPPTVPTTTTPLYLSQPNAALLTSGTLSTLPTSHKLQPTVHNLASDPTLPTSSKFACPTNQLSTHDRSTKQYGSTCLLRSTRSLHCMRNGAEGTCQWYPLQAPVPRKSEPPQFSHAPPATHPNAFSATCAVTCTPYSRTSPPRNR